jgi:hypothetical protein
MRLRQRDRHGSTSLRAAPLPIPRALPSQDHCGSVACHCGEHPGRLPASGNPAIPDSAQCSDVHPVLERDCMSVGRAADPQALGRHLAVFHEGATALSTSCNDTRSSRPRPPPRLTPAMPPTARRPPAARACRSCARRTRRCRPNSARSTPPPASPRPRSADAGQSPDPVPATVMGETQARLIGMPLDSAYTRRARAGHRELSGFRGWRGWRTGGRAAGFGVAGTGGRRGTSLAGRPGPSSRTTLPGLGGASRSR